MLVWNVSASLPGVDEWRSAGNLPGNISRKREQVWISIMCVYQTQLEQMSKWFYLVVPVFQTWGSGDIIWWVLSIVIGQERFH